MSDHRYRKIKKSLWFFGKAFYYLLMDIIWLFSGFFPKDKNIWIFGSWFGRKYADNSKYLFEYVRQNSEEIKAIWLTKSRSLLKFLRDKGIKAYMVCSLKGFYYLLKAGVVVISTGKNDINSFTLRGKKIVMLWHGIPLKKIMYDDKFSHPNDFNSKTGLLFKKIWNSIFPFTSEEYSMSIATSPESQKKFCSAFKMPSYNVIITGYPRNDILLAEDCKPPKILNEMKKRYGFRYLIFYLPTFRGRVGSRFDLFSKYKFDVNKIEETLLMINSFLLIKTHPYNSIEDQHLLNKIHNSKTIRIVTEFDLDGDIYPILRYTDVLITDYSSVYFDFLLLNRPIIFTPFDINEYTSREREFYYNYDDVTPGPKAKNWNEVLKYLKDVFKDPDRFENERRRICDMFNTYHDASSSKRIYEAIMKMLNGKNVR